MDVKSFYKRKKQDDEAANGYAKGLKISVVFFVLLLQLVCRCWEKLFA